MPSGAGSTDIGTVDLEFGDIYQGDDKKHYFGLDQDWWQEYDEDGNNHMIFDGADINMSNKFFVNEAGRSIHVSNTMPSPYYRFDGVDDYIESNDLTQLTLGLDRDSELVARLYDERNPAVKRLIYEVILKAKRNNRKIGICGDAPSSFPDFAQFLVQCGIDSISLSPDAVLRTGIAIQKMEEKLRKQKH